MQPVGVGLVGTGAFGMFCLKAFSTLAEVKIVALADMDRSRVELAAQTYPAEIYDSLDALLGDPRVEIVALNTPPYLHAEQVLACLRAGKHVFCEKPLALTLEEADAIREAAAQSGCSITVDYVMRHNRFWEAAVRLRHEGLLGELLHIDLANHAAGLDLPPEHWFWDTSKSGGIWIEHGVHFFDAFAWLVGATGDIVAAQAFTRSDGSVDRVEAIAQYGNNGQRPIGAHFYHGFTHSGSTEQTTIYMTFEEGYAVLRDWIPTVIEIWSSAAPAQIIPYLVGMTRGVDEASSGQLRHWISYAPEGKEEIYRTAIQAGMKELACVVRDPSRSLTVTLEEGIDSLRMAVEAVERTISI